jgi:hypothetical protein
MDPLRTRLALAALVAVALATLVLSWQVPRTDLPLLVHRQILMVLLGGGLLLSVVVPLLRLPAVVAGVLSKSTLAAVLFAAHAPASQALLEASLGVLLALAGAVFLHDAWQEARWNRGLPLRQG